MSSEEAPEWGRQETLRLTSAHQRTRRPDWAGRAKVRGEVEPDAYL